jgi:hypothetical protein
MVFLESMINPVCHAFEILIANEFYGREFACFNMSAP